MSQMRENCNQVITLLKAKCPFICIPDADEVETMKSVRHSVISLFQRYEEAAKEQGKDFTIKESLKYFEWSLQTGMRSGEYQTFDKKKHPESIWENILVPGKEEDTMLKFQETKNSDTLDPLKALEVFQDAKPDKRKNNVYILVIKDLHVPLQNHPGLTRKIREIIMEANQNSNHKDVTKHIIFLSPIKKLPIDLQVYADWVDWKYPDSDDIMKYLQKRLPGLKIVSPEEKEEKLKKLNSKDMESRLIYTTQEIKDVVNSLTGLPFIRIEEHVSICFARNRIGVFNSKILKELKTKHILENSSLEIMDVSLSVNDVGGMDQLKDWIIQRINSFSEEAIKFGVEPPKGVMLVGIQGCGKTLMAKAVASRWSLPLVRFDVAKVFSKTVGSSEENIRNTLATIEALSPCIVLIDEIEKGLSGVQSSNASDGGTTARVVGTLLSWMNDRTAQAFIIATANDVSQLPPELLRKGRFDEIFFCSLPQINERKDIFKIHLKKRGFNPDDYKVDVFAAMSEHFSGAEIEQVIKNSILFAFETKEKKLKDEHIEKAIKTTVSLFKTCHAEIKWLLRWVGWDEELQEGLKARFASKEGKTIHAKPGEKEGEHPNKRGGSIKLRPDANQPDDEDDDE